MGQPTPAALVSVWPHRLTRVPVPLLGLAVGLLALAVLYVEVPGRPLILHALQKLGHPAVFAAMAVTLFGMRRRLRPMSGIWSDYGSVFLIGTGLGIATELAQVLTHRDPAVKDVLLDVRGITGALALLAAFDPRWRLGLSARRVRHLFLSVAVLVMAITVGPVLWVAGAYAHRSLEAPTLFAPRHSIDLLLVSLTDSAPELSAMPAGYARQADERGLRVPLTTRPYAGVVLDEPLSDWRSYRTLRIDITNPARSELTLHIRVQDRAHNGLYTDRFEGAEPIPGNTRRVIEIPVEKIAGGPLRRRLDLAHIGPITLYKTSGEGPREMWLGSVELIR